MLLENRICLLQEGNSPMRLFTASTEMAADARRSKLLLQGSASHWCRLTVLHCEHMGLVPSCLLQGRGWMYWKHVCQQLIGRGMTAFVGNQCVHREAPMHFRGHNSWEIYKKDAELQCFASGSDSVEGLQATLMKLSSLSSACVRLSVWTPNVVSICKWFGYLCEINCFLAYRRVHLCFIHGLSKIS